MGFLHLLDLNPHRKVIIEVGILSIANKNPLAYVQKGPWSPRGCVLEIHKDREQIFFFPCDTLFLTVSFPESLHQSSLTKCPKLSPVIDSEWFSKPFNGRWDGTCDCLASPENLEGGLREAWSTQRRGELQGEAFVEEERLDICV